MQRMEGAGREVLGCQALDLPQHAHFTVAEKSKKDEPNCTVTFKTSVQTWPTSCLLTFQQGAFVIVHKECS